MPILHLVPRKKEKKESLVTWLEKKLVTHCQLDTLANLQEKSTGKYPSLTLFFFAVWNNVPWKSCKSKPIIQEIHPISLYLFSWKHILSRFKCMLLSLEILFNSIKLFVMLLIHVVSLKLSTKAFPVQMVKMKTN